MTLRHEKWQSLYIIYRRVAAWSNLSFYPRSSFSPVRTLQHVERHKIVRNCRGPCNKFYFFCYSDFYTRKIIHGSIRSSNSIKRMIKLVCVKIMEICDTCYCLGTYLYHIVVDSTKCPRVLFHISFVKFLTRVYNIRGIFNY